MSAIAGVFHPDGRPVDHRTVRGMLQTMPYRCMDGSDVWCGDGVCLGHGMLQTTPESLEENLPFSSPDGTLTITADARIDNRDDLFGELGLTARAGDEVIPDSRLILLAYEKWGEDCPAHLYGAFTFVIWDAARRVLFCARDHMGINPFVYYHAPGRSFVFGTEIKAVLAAEGVEERIDVKVFTETLLREVIEPEKTVFADIRHLPAGHSAIVDQDGFRAWRYWNPSFEPVLEGLSDEQYADRFLELFTEAVRCRLRTTHRIGSELSGGLDSSFVTCVAADLLNSDAQDPLTTLSLRYEEAVACDEWEYISAVLDDGRFKPHIEIADRQGLFSVLSEIYEVLDDGRAGGQHHLNWLTSRLAGRNGIRVLLTGQDGDSTVYHGWESLAFLAQEGNWEEFCEEAHLTVQHILDEGSRYDLQEKIFSNPRAVLNAYGGTALRRQAQSGNILSFLRSVEQIHKCFGVDRREIYRRMWKDLLVPSFLRSSGTKKEHSAARSDWPDIVHADVARCVTDSTKSASSLSESTGVRERHLRNILAPERTSALEKLNHYAAAHGVEARHPFMDIRLVEYCLRLPPEQSFKQGWSRVVMRRAMKGIVPEKVRKRTGKANLTEGYRTVLFKDETDIQRNLSELDRAGGLFNIERLRSFAEDRVPTDDTTVLGDAGLALSLITWLIHRDDDLGQIQ